MKVKSLKLENFRNYEKLDLNLDSETNLIYGKNGQGKTNIIEAVYMFAVARSHRVLKDRDMIMYDKPYAKLKMEFSRESRDMEAEIILFGDKNREIYVNGIRAKRNAELIGNFNAVLFSPEDFCIIKDGPSERRRFTDIAISQVKPNYFGCLNEYHKLLKMKNKALKEDKAFFGMIDVYNEKMAENAANIIYYRNKFYEFASQICGNLHREMTLTGDKFTIKYESCVPVAERSEMKKNILKNMERLKEKECFERVSLFGTHKEDISFYINGKKVREFASQGQQRTVILILKLIQAEYIKNITGEYPVLLLDDILSELDKDRRKYILNEIKNKQVIITATDKGSFSRRKNTSLIYVEDSNAIREEKK